MFCIYIIIMYIHIYLGGVLRVGGPEEPADAARERGEMEGEDGQLFVLCGGCLGCVGLVWLGGWTHDTTDGPSAYIIYK